MKAASTKPIVFKTKPAVKVEAKPAKLATIASGAMA